MLRHNILKVLSFRTWFRARVPKVCIMTLFIGIVWMKWAFGNAQVPSNCRLGKHLGVYRKVFP